MKVNPSRRKFIRQLGSSSLLLAAGTLKTLAADEKNEERIIAYTKKIGPNDKIRIATIGMGIMGHADSDSALKVPGVELVAVSDLIPAAWKGQRKNTEITYIQPGTTVSCCNEKTSMP